MADEIHLSGDTSQAAVPLAQIPRQIWQLFGAAIVDPGHPFRTPVIATSGKRASTTRIVVLRNIDIEQQHLECYTDFRSAKIRQLGGSDALSWNFYDSTRRLQVRAWGSAEVLNDDDYTHRCWAQLKDYQKQAYAQVLAPGEQLETRSPDPPPPVTGEIETGRDNFAVIRSCIHDFEWLQLARAGHRRASVVYANGRWSSRWLIP